MIGKCSVIFLKLGKQRPSSRRATEDGLAGVVK